MPPAARRHRHARLVVIESSTTGSSVCRPSSRVNGRKPSTTGVPWSRQLSAAGGTGPGSRPAGASRHCSLTRTCSLLDARARYAFWRDQLQRAALTQVRLRRNAQNARPHVFPARSSRLQRIATRGRLAVGDAAATFDPLSSQGLTWALETGLGRRGSIDASLEVSQARWTPMRGGLKANSLITSASGPNITGSSAAGPNLPSG